MQPMKRVSTKKGLTALVAILIMSVAMTAALAIFQLLFTESLIARDQQESVVAEYAAESGIECMKYNIYAKSYDASKSPPNPLRCNGIDYGFTKTQISPSVWELTFSPSYPMTQVNACAAISMSYGDIGTERIIYMRSHGRYPCDNPRVERAIETSLKQAIP